MQKETVIDTKFHCEIIPARRPPNICEKVQAGFTNTIRYLAAGSSQFSVSSTKGELA